MLKFIVDECTGPGVADWLLSQGHDVCSVYDSRRGISDDDVLAIANREARIIITNDKDFGQKIYRDRKEHRGVILLRLGDERTENEIRVLRKLLAGYAEQLFGQFVVVTEKRVRFAGSGNR